LTTPDEEEPGKTAPIEVQAEATTPAPPAAAPPAPPAPAPEPTVDDGRLSEPIAAAAPTVPIAQGPVYVPLAVTVGDGFKFGCGFFLALVLAMLIGFVLLAALFVLTNLFGLNLPITR
jgi:hypothetical protein